MWLARWLPLVLAFAAATLTACVPEARATWSIVVADERTKEVAIGSVTCLTGYDLRAITPVVRVGVGAAACQSAGDFAGLRRPILARELAIGTAPDDMLPLVEAVGGHQQRQYGIADVQGRATTFTGTQCAAWAGGVTGRVGTMVYAIQGNILAGPCVVPAAEAALRDTPGDIPTKLMAAMEAARANAGDGRCSCTPAAPESCGCPPPAFTLSGNIGYMIDARRGDVDDDLCDANGCADGTYCMNLNIPYSSAADPDPVGRLRVAFDAWRASLVGQPDSLLSRVSIAPAGADHEMIVELLDWQQLPVTSPVTLAVTHETTSAGIAAIGAPVDLGGGRFSVTLTTRPGAGIDRYRVDAQGGACPGILAPSPELCFGDPCACDPGNPANRAPGAATDLRVAPGALVTWATPPEAWTSALHSGALAELAADRGVARAACLAYDLASPSVVDARPAPAGNGSGFYYLAEGRNACGDGGVGEDSLGAARVVSSCP